MSKEQFLIDGKFETGHGFSGRQETVRIVFDKNKNGFDKIFIRSSICADDESYHCVIKHTLTDSAVDALIEWLQKNKA